MRVWKLQAGDPLSLTLAADVRTSPTDYADDQIWELKIGGGDPPALALQTSYGLRAASFRLFPRFREGHSVIFDPETFFSPPTITQIFPNLITLTFCPLPEIEVRQEYWLAQSHALACWVDITNQGETERHLQIEWVGQLTPSKGSRMAPMEIQLVKVLAGRTNSLKPVLFITGGATPKVGPYPNLCHNIALPPKTTHPMTICHAATQDETASFNLARSLAATSWVAERARLEMFNSSYLDISTGEADWDAAFMLTQKVALGLFVGPTAHLPCPSIVQSRLPDQGYSLRGDGSDYSHLWNGQTALDAYFIANLLLPVAPNLIQGLLRNFLAIQKQDGSISWKPGLAGQCPPHLATPILAHLALRTHEFTQDTAFLQEVFPGLANYVRRWFSEQQDSDRDGVPEWSNLMQSGMDEHPLYSPWQTWSKGFDISSAECVSLASLLYRECQSLIEMAQLLNHEQPLEEWQVRAENLKSAVESAWDEKLACYFNRDRDTHLRGIPEWLGERVGSGSISIQRAFIHPTRLHISIQTSGSSRHPLSIYVHGVSASGHPRVERMRAEKITWHLGRGNLTGDLIYSAVERVDFEGLAPDDQVTISSVGHEEQDISLLLPLWAGIPSPDRALTLVNKTLTNPKRFWREYGIPLCLSPRRKQDAEICQAVHVAWNCLIGEGCLQYHLRHISAELVTRLMEAIIQSLKKDRMFRQYYHADNGKGMGERDVLGGLAPLGFFMDTLGVRILSPRRVALAGQNPFPWPVTIKHRGLTILRQHDKTYIVFPEGQSLTVEDPQPCTVSLEMTP